MDVLGEVAAAVENRFRGGGRLLVAVDGPDAAGKTTFADALAARPSVPVVRASVDGFHDPREVPARRGVLPRTVTTVTRSTSRRS